MRLERNCHSQIPQEPPKRSPTQIVIIALHSISFPFKGNSPISLVVILKFYQAYQVFNEVPEVKRENAHFQLLPEVDPFVVQEDRTVVTVFGQDERKKRYSFYPQKWNVNQDSFQLTTFLANSKAIISKSRKVNFPAFTVSIVSVLPGNI